MTDKDAEELLQSSKEQRRHTTDPATDDSSPTDEPGQSLEDAVADAYAAFDDGGLHPNVTVRDADLAALVEGLEQTGELAAVTERANDRLGRDAATDTKADLVKALVRVGLDAVASEEVEAAKNGKRMHLTSQADDF